MLDTKSWFQNPPPPPAPVFERVRVARSFLVKGHVIHSGSVVDLPQRIVVDLLQGYKVERAPDAELVTVTDQEAEQRALDKREAEIAGQELAHAKVAAAARGKRK